MNRKAVLPNGLWQVALSYSKDTTEQVREKAHMDNAIQLMQERHYIILHTFQVVKEYIPKLAFKEAFEETAKTVLRLSNPEDTFANEKGFIVLDSEINKRIILVLHRIPQWAKELHTAIQKDILYTAANIPHKYQVVYDDEDKPYGTCIVGIKKDAEGYYRECQLSNGASLQPAALMLGAVKEIVDNNPVGFVPKLSQQISF